MNSSCGPRRQGGGKIRKATAEFKAGKEEEKKKLKTGGKRGQKRHSRGGLPMTKTDQGEGKKAPKGKNTGGEKNIPWWWREGTQPRKITPSLQNQSIE